METRTLYLYVDDAYVGAIRTAWPLKRVLRFLQDLKPRGTTHEVATEKRWQHGDEVLA